MTSKPTIPRRSILTGSIALAATPTIALGTGDAAEREFLTFLRQRRLYAQALHYSDGWCESNDETTISAFQACDIEFEGYARHCLRQPPRSWTDVAIRAEIARHWALEYRGGQLAYECTTEMPTASLIAAVRAMTGEPYEVPVALYPER